MDSSSSFFFLTLTIGFTWEHTGSGNQLEEFNIYLLSLRLFGDSDLDWVYDQSTNQWKTWVAWFVLVGEIQTLENCGIGCSLTIFSVSLMLSPDSLGLFLSILHVLELMPEMGSQLNAQILWLCQFCLSSASKDLVSSPCCTSEWYLSIWVWNKDIWLYFNRF